MADHVEHDQDQDQSLDGTVDDVLAGLVPSEQLELLTDEQLMETYQDHAEKQEIEALRKSKSTVPMGESTAERVLRRTPDRYRAAVLFLAEGIGITRMSKLLKMHPRTIMAIRERESGSDGAIETLKKRLSQYAFGVAEMCQEGLMDVLSDPILRSQVSAYHLALIQGISIDKAQLLGGGPTARVSLERDAPPVDDFNAMIKDITAEVSDLRSDGDLRSMGVAGETPGQKGERPEPGPAALPAHSDDLRSTGDADVWTDELCPEAFDQLDDSHDSLSSDPEV